MYKLNGHVAQLSVARDELQRLDSTYGENG